MKNYFIQICEINEELFYPDFVCNIMGFSLHQCKWHIFCAEKWYLVHWMQLCWIWNFCVEI